MNKNKLFDPKALIVIDHGSRNPIAHGELQDLTQRLSCLCGLMCIPAHMEIASPSLDEAIQKCVELGKTQVRIIPWFLSSGRHLSEDIPNLVRTVGKKYPQVQIQLCQSLGQHQKLAELAWDLSFLVDH